jgi:DHA1 family inner membrane transport protein
MPLALYALTAGAFGIGVTEFVIMGLLLEVSADLGVTIATAGLLISGYALGVVVGAPILTVLTGRSPHKRVLIGLMAIFTAGNLACALAPSYGFLMAARVLTALAHGTFFGVGSVVATELVPVDRKASAIAMMFTGLTVANILGVPLGTWIGQQLGWRATVSPILLVFGGGLVIGNLVGGRLADRNLVATVFGTLALLGVVLALMTLGFHSRVLAIVLTGLLGAAGFATVAPLQMWVLSNAEGVGRSLASSFNIAAFNLGNAIGAWVGGVVIDHGLGLSFVPLVAAAFPAAAVLVALLNVNLSGSKRAAAIGQP